MRAMIALGFILLAATPAFADNPNARAEREARTWLKPCKEKDKGWQQVCLLHQRNFIENYVFAKSGDVSAMSSTSAEFFKLTKNDDEYRNDLGNPVNLLQACAWRIVTIQSSRDDMTGMKQTALWLCNQLSPNERQAAIERADVLLAELRHTPAKEPAEDWEPKVAGLVPDPPMAKIDPKCMDSSAHSLDEVDIPDFVPPPGCPK